MTNENTLSNLVLAFPFLLMSFFFISFNIVIYIDRRRGVSASSLFPFVGGVSGCVGLLCVGVQPWTALFWIPIFLDPGCGPAVLSFVWGYIRSGSCRKDRVNNDDASSDFK
ncbi:MAG: hypothetical protein RLZZ383_356 [Pseudomonadota bacterium]|jgi:hypothetical protein